MVTCLEQLSNRLDFIQLSSIQSSRRSETSAVFRVISLTRVARFQQMLNYTKVLKLAKRNLETGKGRHVFLNFCSLCARNQASIHPLCVPLIRQSRGEGGVNQSVPVDLEHESFSKGPQLPLFHQDSSRAGLELVPNLKLVLFISTSKTRLSARNSVQNQEPFMSWAGGGIIMIKNVSFLLKRNYCRQQSEQAAQMCWTSHDWMSV